MLKGLGCAEDAEIVFFMMGAFATKAKAAVDRLREAVAKGVAHPETHPRLLDLGIDLVASQSADEFAAFIKSENIKWAKVIRQANIRAE